MARFFNRFAAAARVVGGALAGSVLLFELLAANSAFHQALHQGNDAPSATCILCLLAKGQVDSPESAPIVTPSVCISFAPTPRVASTVVVDFTYLASLSRAPPAPAFLLSVVA